MHVRTKSIVCQVVRPVWNAWMRFGNHQLSLSPEHVDGSKVSLDSDCSSQQASVQNCSVCSSGHSESRI